MHDSLRKGAFAADINLEARNTGKTASAGIILYDVSGYLKVRVNDFMSDMAIRVYIPLRLALTARVSVRRAGKVLCGKNKSK